MPAEFNNLSAFSAAGGSQLQELAQLVNHVDGNGRPMTPYIGDLYFDDKEPSFPSARGYIYVGYLYPSWTFVSSIEQESSAHVDFLYDPSGRLSRIEDGATYWGAVGYGGLTAFTAARTIIHGVGGNTSELRAQFIGYRFPIEQH